jgi:amino acid transporter
MAKQIGFFEAFSIGVGGMVGGGIFAVLGLTIVLAKGAAPLAFALAGVIALVTVYSYVKLSLRYPSEGGTIEFIVQAFGNGLFTSMVNTLMLMSYVVMLALYAYAFGSYGSALILGKDVPWLHDALAAGVITVFTLINLLGAVMTGKAEDIMVFVKLVILLIFAIAGYFTIDWNHMATTEWMPLPSVAAGGLIIFLAYEGFELIANTARDIKDPQKNLPRAYYSSVLFVIALYVVIAAVAVGNLGFEEAKNAKDYALAEAAKPLIAFDLHNISVAGSLGFLIVFMLVNLANFKLSKETGANRFIAGAGTLLCLGAALVLVGYNAVHDPVTLISSAVLITATALFTFVYVRFNKRLSSFMDKRLEREEGIKNSLLR